MGIETDNRQIYKNVIGACASCKYIRSQSEGLYGELIEYNGGKRGYCSRNHYIDPISGEPNNTSTTILIKELPIKPDMSLPINKCWEPKIE